MEIKHLVVIATVVIVGFLMFLLTKWHNFKKVNRNDERGQFVIGKVSSTLYEWSYVDIAVIVVAQMIIEDSFLFLLTVLLLLVIKTIVLIILLKKYDNDTQ